MGSSYHTLFLLNDNTIKSVGANKYGQCGTGITSTNQLSLYTIPNLNNVKQVSCGVYHTVFLLNDGTVRTVGQNTYGQCGTGNTTTPQLSLYTIPSLNNVKQVACGMEYTAFLLNDGTVKTVGYNNHGQCGTGSTSTNQLSLYTIRNLTNVKQISCGENYTVFLLDDGTVKTVGYNGFGQCGTGNTTSPQLSLYTIPNLTNVKQVACGSIHTVFLLNDGTVITVGHNAYGQCGTGSAVSSQSKLYTIPNLNNVKQVACGQYYTVFLLNDGTVKTVGHNSSGQCGTGNTTTPQLLLYTIPDLNNVKQITCSVAHTIFLLEDGTVKTVGNNNSGQCGTGNTYTPQLSLYTIPDLNNVKSLFDIYNMKDILYLIKQYNNYYSIKPEYYDINAKTFSPLQLLDNISPNTNDIKLYGFNNINDLCNNITLNGETFKPIDKLLSTFKLNGYNIK